jgi:phosphoribosylanthranilate isomerase
MTNNRNIREIAMLYPDYMGFIFHGDSVRDVTGTIGQLQLSVIPPRVKKVAVMVDQPIEYVKNIVATHGFEAVQLHGDEEPDYCRELSDVCQVIKAFRIEDSLPADLEKYAGSCHLFLFDAKGVNQGGNGIKFNHDILKEYKIEKPFILSGGIGDNDLPYLQSVDMEWLTGVDLNSRFELSPGYKSHSSLKEFISKLRTNGKVDK